MTSSIPDLTGNRPSDLERCRRALKEGDPVLYAYIANVEQCKAYESAAGLASGALDGHRAANRLYERLERLRAVRGASS